MPVTYVPMHRMPNAIAAKKPHMGERHVPPQVGEFAYFETNGTREWRKDHWIVQTTDQYGVGAHFSCAERSLEIPYISCNGMIHDVIRHVRNSVVFY